MSPSPIIQGLSGSFSLAAGELGMCSAAWLFSSVLLDGGGPELLQRVRDELGAEFPVFDAVADLALRGRRTPTPDPSALLAAIGQARRVVIVGLESLFLDALVGQLEGVKIAVLRQSPFDVDWDRILANFDGRVAFIDLETFQTWAGPRSVLVTFAYGIHGHATFVVPAWERVVGADVRMQFRSLVAWDVLDSPFFVYPRWLVEVPTAGFTQVVSAG